MKGRTTNCRPMEVDALRRLQAETAADPPLLYFGVTRLNALLPAVLDRGFRGSCDL